MMSFAIIGNHLTWGVRFSRVNELWYRLHCDKWCLLICLNSCLVGGVLTVVKGVEIYIHIALLTEIEPTSQCKVEEEK